MLIGGVVLWKTFIKAAAKNSRLKLQFTRAHLGIYIYVYIHMYGKEDLEVDAHIYIYIKCVYIYDFYFKSLYGLDHWDAGGVYFLATL